MTAWAKRNWKVLRRKCKWKSLLYIGHFFLTALCCPPHAMSIPWALLKVCVNGMMMICVLLAHKQTLHRQHLHGLEKSITNALCCIQKLAVAATALSLPPETRKGFIRHYLSTQYRDCVSLLLLLLWGGLVVTFLRLSLSLTNNNLRK